MDRSERNSLSVFPTNQQTELHKSTCSSEEKSLRCGFRGDVLPTSNNLRVNVLGALNLASCDYPTREWDAVNGNNRLVFLTDLDRKRSEL